MSLPHGRPLRGAVIGYGFISSKGHIPAYLKRAQDEKDVEIVAIADTCEGRRYAVAEDLPGVRIYTDGDALLSSEGDLDFVDIATPPYDHARLTHAALDRNLHVLCEKPLTMSTAEARSVIEHARRAKRVVFPVHNYRHAPVVKAIRNVIESGQIGKVRSVTLNTFRNTHAKGVNEWHTHWRREKKYSGGGIAMDHGSHTFYLTFEWLGSYPTAITASMRNVEPDRYDTEDNFSAVLTFPNGLAHVHLTWTAGVRKVIYTVQGTQGAIVVDDDEIQVAEMRKTSGPDVAQGAVEWRTRKETLSSHWMDASHVSWFNSLFQEFRDAIDRDLFVSPQLKESYLCVQAIERAYESASKGSLELALSPEVP